MTDRRPDRRRSLSSALALAIVLVALPSAALGHGELVSSSPEAGANLAIAPSEVTLTFDDELDPDKSSFTVADAAGTQVGGGTVDLAVADRNVMRGEVAIEDPGLYTVSYIVAGPDGHAVEGSFTFGYQADAPPPDTAVARRTTGALTAAGLVLIAVGLLAASATVRRRGLR